MKIKGMTINHGNIDVNCIIVNDADIYFKSVDIAKILNRKSVYNTNGRINDEDLLYVEGLWFVKPKAILEFIRDTSYENMEELEQSIFEIVRIMGFSLEDVFPKNNLRININRGVAQSEEKRDFDSTFFPAEFTDSQVLAAKQFYALPAHERALRIRWHSPTKNSATLLWYLVEKCLINGKIDCAYISVRKFHKECKGIFNTSPFKVNNALKSLNDVGYIQTVALEGIRRTAINVQIMGNLFELLCIGAELELMELQMVLTYKQSCVLAADVLNTYQYGYGGFYYHPIYLAKKYNFPHYNFAYGVKSDDFMVVSEDRKIVLKDEFLEKFQIELNSFYESDLLAPLRVKNQSGRGGK